MSTISASTTSTTAYKVTADTTGTLVLQTGATPTTAVTIDGSQNVGIGTSSPANKLDVNGGMKMASSQWFAMGSNNTFYSDASYGLIIKAPATSNFIAFRSSDDTERMRIDTSGNLLVGRTSAFGYSEKLAVAGTIATSGTQLNVLPGADFEFVQRSAYKMNFYVNSGSVMASLSITGVWTNASDARYKENITDSQYGLSTVMALKPRAYNLIDQADKPQIGFIAQEVLEIVPEVVESVHNSVIDEDRYTLSYGNLIPVLTKAIQEQQAMITSQSELINAQQAALNTLTERISALENK